MYYTSGTISTLEYTPRLSGACISISREVCVYGQTSVMMRCDTHSLYISTFLEIRAHKKWLSHNNIFL